MSISNIGTSSSGELPQMLQTLLSRLEAASTSGGSDSNAASSASIATLSAANSLTGSTTPSLSTMILGTLIGMQVQSSSDAAQSTSSESPTTGPVQQLFSTIDTSGDGKISQSELENYIEKLGGTQAEADSLYSALAQPGSNGITESQLASDAPTGPPPGGFAGPGSLLSASGASSSLIAMLSNLVQTLNTNAGASFGQLSSSSSLISQADNLMQSINAAGSGNITETDLEEFFTANGGTASQADKDFAALDTSGSTSLNSADFANALENLESNAGSGLPALTLLNALAQNATNGASRSSSA